MSDIIEWDNMIIPNDFRNMSMEMAEAYKKLEESDEEKSLKEEKERIKKQIDEPTSYSVDSLNSSYDSAAYLVVIILRIIGFIVLGNVSGPVYYSVADKYELGFFVVIPLLAFCVAAPILLIRRGMFVAIFKVFSNYNKKLENAKQKDRDTALLERELHEESLKDIESKLKNIEKEREKVRELAKRYERLYAIWKEQAYWARKMNVPWARESSDIEIISTMVQYVSSNCFSKDSSILLVSDAFDKYKCQMEENMALVKQAQATLRDIFGNRS